MDQAIVDDYAASLRELTFNSRPIIENLTTIAKENTDYADGFLHVITTRIYKTIPEHKLFALYLLDSVCKNVGNPYNILVGDEIFKLFSHVYQMVDDQTRARLAKIYETWKLSKTKGSNAPLFPPEETDKIGRFLHQLGYQKPEPVPVISANQLIGDIDTLLPIMEKKLVANPSDAALSGRCGALQQLRGLLQSQSLKNNDLLGIQEKLALMKQQELQAPVSIATPATTPVRAVSVEVKAPSKAQALFADLLASGLVKMDQSLKPGSKPVYELVMPKEKYSAVSANPLEQLLKDANGGSQYDQIKLKELVKISAKITEKASLQSFISTSVLEASTVQLLYECKPLKCAQCGKRFTSEETDKKRIHLDWHFRINKKQANFKSNIQSRNWYLDDLEWVRFTDDELLEYGSTKKETVSTVVNQVARAQYVVIPSTETNMNNTCNICREQIKPTYNDQLGEWVWDECMYAPGTKSGRKIVHVSCFNERKRAGDEMEGVVKRER